MRTSVWLIRHGQTVANRERRYQSHSDSPLTDYGRRQIAALAVRLRRIPFELALVSPAGRAGQTAAAIVAGRDGVTPRPDPAWAELSHGRWEGLTYREVLARHAGEARARWAAGTHGRAAGGESLSETAERVGAAWRGLLREHAGGRILIVADATPIQLTLCLALGLPVEAHWRWRVDLGSVTALDVYAGGSAIVRMVNEVPKV